MSCVIPGVIHVTYPYDRCTFRFPSTNIKLVFQSLVEDPSAASDQNNHKDETNRQRENLKSFANPLKVNIPTHHGSYGDSEYGSPIPSPTQTISAANSCPSSPRSAGITRNLQNRHQIQQHSAQHNNQQDLHHMMVAYAAAAVASDGHSGPTHGRGSGGGQKKKNSGASAHHDSNLQIHHDLSDNHHDYGYGSQTSIQSQMAGGTDSGANSPTGVGGMGSGGDGIDDSKPPYSYAQLIVQAISSAYDKQLTLSGIYSYITKHYPYYRTAEKGWQV